MPGKWGRLQRAGAVALVVLSCGVAVAHCGLSSELPFLWPGSAPAWWMPPEPVSADLMQWGQDEVPVTRYAARLELAVPPAQAELALRAFGAFTLRVNGSVPEGGAGDGASWRRLRRVEIGPLLRAGANEIAVDVANRHGPALLALDLSSLGIAPGTEAFEVSRDGRPLGRALRADDTRQNPASLAVETPAEALGRTALPLLGLFAAGAAGFWLLQRRSPAGLSAALPGAALGVATLAWAWLFTAKIWRIPLFVGFDARHHLAYVDFLREQHALPLATDGWSMFHPPLFYALAALLFPFGNAALRVIPWISGLGNVFVTHSLAQRLHPGDGRVALLAVLFAAVLPVNLYSSAYFTNESFHALLAGVALVAGVDALLAPRTSARQAAWLGATLGFAALAKFTALAFAPVALFFLAIKLVAIERAPLARAAGRVACAAGLLLLVCGWYYARNWILLGTPIAGNWGHLSGERAWWQQPGFHTAGWYLHFGEALRHPYLSGFVSFGDGLYSTFWGDGGIGGRVNPDQRHGFWHHDFVSAAFLIGLAASALLGLGVWRALRRAFSDGEDARLRAALSFVWTACYAVAFSLLWLTVSLPYFAQAKGSYALCLIGPLSLAFADAAAGVDSWLAARGALAWRCGLAGLLSALLGGFFLGYAA